MTRQYPPDVLITPELRRRVEARVAELRETAKLHFKREFELPTIDYALRGRVGGRAKAAKNRISLNAVLLAENEAHFIEQTVGHEVAHLVAGCVFGPRIRPHGREWQSVMCLFDLPAHRCHTYDVRNAQVRSQRQYSYRCGCGFVKLSAVRHNRMVRGQAEYQCKKCGKALLRG